MAAWLLVCQGSERASLSLHSPGRWAPREAALLAGLSCAAEAAVAEAAGTPEPPCLTPAHKWGFNHSLIACPAPTQDCNLLQVAIVVLLGGGSGRVTVVGDDDQRCGGRRCAAAGLAAELLHAHEGHCMRGRQLSQHENVHARPLDCLLTIVPPLHCAPTCSIYRFMAATPGVFQLFKDA